MRSIVESLEEPVMVRSRANELVQRVSQLPFSRLILALAFVLIPQIAAQALVRSVVTSHGLVADVLVNLAYILLGVLAYRVYVVVVEKRVATELGGKGAAREAGIGILLGVGLLSLTIAILWVVGAYRISGYHSWVVLVPTLTIAVTFGLLEEIVFRGILFRITEEWIGTWLALAVSAALFGVLHAANPSASVWSTTAITLEAGLLLAAAFLVTGRLWLPIGLHIGWNFAQGGIFGVAVSGNQRTGLLQAQLIGSQWITGGSFGVEASIVAVATCFVAFAAMIAFAVKRQRIRKRGPQRESLTRQGSPATAA